MSNDQELVDRYIRQSQEFQRLVTTACGDNTQLRNEIMTAFKTFYGTAIELERKLKSDPGFAQAFQTGLAKVDPTTLPKI